MLFAAIVPFYVMNNQCVQDIVKLLLFTINVNVWSIINRPTTRGASFHDEGEMIYEINKIANN